MARRRSRTALHYVLNLGLSLAVLGVFAVTGVRVMRTTSAATSHPYGSADYCALEDNATVIYGWAADPDAGPLSSPAVSLIVGDRTTTTHTNRANYRNAAVADWIRANRSGDPTPGTYGFKVVMSGLYKGAQIPISGTVLNEGSGANTILAVNNASPIDGDASKYFFKDNLIPQECLAPVPLAGQPAAGTSPVTSLPTPKPANGVSAGATALAGTLAAELKIRTDATATVRVVYGKNPANLNLSSSDMPVSGPETILALTGLAPATDYAYRIIRTDVAGKKTTSPMGNFRTLGYVIAMHFVDSKSAGIAGISATLEGADKQKTSDDNGDVQFTDVSGGNHTVSFTYLGRTYKKMVTADAALISPAEASAARVVTLDHSIDIEAVVATGSRPVVKNNGPTALMIAASLGFLALILVIAASLRFRKKRRYDAYFDDPAPPLPAYQPLIPPVVPGQVSPPAAHMGESLKDLVIKSMTDGSTDPRNDTNDRPGS